jgi:uncharacterized membrane protein YcaP (DUF421 family)
MNLLNQIWGQGKDLNALQMSSRAIIVFIFCLILIRISGRRSFGVRTPIDNIIVILLGTILGRAVVGASPFLPIIVASFLLTIAHRFMGWVIVHYKWAGKIIEGDKINLFSDGKFKKENLKRGLVCEEDVMQGVRKSALTEDLNKIDKIYIERSGEISALKKE